MKKAILCVILAALLLTGCGAPAELPDDWQEDWTVVCPVLAVEPMEGFSLYESNDALYLNGIYYATWVTGEPREHTNEEGESAQVFDGQFYVLVQEFRSEESGKANVAEWIAREKQTYETGTEAAMTCAGQEFTLLTLERSGEANPYSHGAAAFGRWGNWAVCVEYLCADGFDQQPEKTLEAFLNGFHYSE